MGYKVRLFYFKPTGQILAVTDAWIEHDGLADIWEEIHELRRMGSLPGLRPNAGRDLTILVDVHDHPNGELHIVFPPALEEEDVTPIRVPTGAMPPLSRTSTKDVLSPDDTPVDPIPLPIRRAPTQDDD